MISKLRGCGCVSGDCAEYRSVAGSLLTPNPFPCPRVARCSFHSHDNNFSRSRLGTICFCPVFFLYPKTYFWLYPSQKTNAQEIGQIVASVLTRHFGNIVAADLLILSREFPKRVHVELHDRLHSLLAEKPFICSHGLEVEYFELVRMNECLVQSRREVRLVPFSNPLKTITKKAYPSTGSEKNLFK